jgi:hypothetical protein
MIITEVGSSSGIYLRNGYRDLSLSERAIRRIPPYPRAHTSLPLLYPKIKLLDLSFSRSKTQQP